MDFHRSLRGQLSFDFFRRARIIYLDRDSPDGSRTGVNIGAFPTFLQDRREVRTVIGTSGSPHGGRGSDLGIFAGIWTHGSRRLLLNP